MFHAFEVFIYQPFFNLLVGLYWLLNQVPGFTVDMGVAVIVFTILIRILLLPLSPAAHRQEKTRKEIEAQIKNIEEKYANDPVTLRQESKTTFRRNRGIVVAELVSLTIQVIVALMLWKVFGSGLQGEDAHLLYSWMPKIFPIPDEELMFWGYSLWEPHWQLNLIQSLLIFVVETFSIYVSPYPPRKGEVVRLQLVLPVISFIIFSQLPGGKKLFVIVTLLFSLAIILVSAVSLKVKEIQARIQKKEELAQKPEDKVLVDVH